MNISSKAAVDALVHWAEQYPDCAVHNVPYAVYELLPTRGNYTIEYSSELFVNVRFCNGLVAGVIPGILYTIGRFGIVATEEYHNIVHTGYPKRVAPRYFLQAEEISDIVLMQNFF